MDLRFTIHGDGLTTATIRKATITMDTDLSTRRLGGRSPNIPNQTWQQRKRSRDAEALVAEKDPVIQPVKEVFAVRNVDEDFPRIQG